MNNTDIVRTRIQDITLHTDDYRVKWAGYAVAYYIYSGRAPSDWIRAFLEADTRSLLDYMASGRDLSDNGLMRRAHTYLTRNHGLSA